MQNIDTKQMLKDFLEPVRIDLDFQGTRADFQVTDDNKFVLELSEIEEGNAGISYGSMGIATNKDQNGFYSPTRARGIGRNFGLYHQAFLESQAFQDAWGKIEQGLVTSHWYISPVECEDEDVAEYAKRQANAVKRILFGIDGGWDKHVREALYMLVGGFAPFLRITDGLGQLKGLSFRYPSQVKRWLTDDNEQYYLGIEFDGNSSNSKPYVKLANELLLYQFRSMGNDFEGMSVLRSVITFIEAHKLFVRLEAVAAEKFGAPYVTVERPEGNYDESADQELIYTLDGMIATDGGVILLPGGYRIVVSSPQGQMPNFEAVKRYCDEKIATILSAEGALIGLNGKGAYNVAEIKDDQQLRSLAYYGRVICSTINDKTAAGHESLIQSIVHNLKDVDGEDLSMTINGEYPKLQWALSPEQDETNLDQILDVFKSGVIAMTEDDETWIRNKLKLPAKTVKKASPEQVAALTQAVDGVQQTPVEASSAPED